VLGEHFVDDALDLVLGWCVVANELKDAAVPVHAWNTKTFVFAFPESFPGTARTMVPARHAMVGANAFFDAAA